MKKVQLPREVADALDNSKHMGSVAIMGHLAKYGSLATTTQEMSVIYSFYLENPYLIASALVNGYEVEQKPEDKVKTLYSRPDNNFANSHSYRAGMRDALNAFGIKIEGVNT